MTSDQSLGGGDSEGGSPDILAELTKHPFFGEFPSEHLKVFASYAMPTQFKGGDWIFEQGDPANRFYLVLEGRVALCATNGGEIDPVLIQTVGPGEVLGWSWLFPPFRWNFGAVAVEPTRALFFYGTWLREKCELQKDMGYAVMSRMAQMAIERLQATRRLLLKQISKSR